RIFISYRRKDSRKDTGRIYDRLVGAFGRANIFKDVDNIPPGSTYPEELDKAIVASDIFLVMIGGQWIDIRDEAGSRRLDDATDPVRLEIERGLQQGESLRMIPVLVDDATMPTANQLPVSLRPLAFKNAVVVRDDPDFNRDVERLVGHIRQITGAPLGMTRRISPIWVALVMAVLIGTGLLIVQTLRQPVLPETADLTQTADASAMIAVIDAASATETPPPIASFTATNTDEPTNTPSATRTPSETPTPELEALAMTFEAEQSATAGFMETLTATAWTNTPTANATETFAVFLTERASGNLTATAEAWTDTPTHTPTATRTHTPTYTRTFTPSPTSTPTNTPIPLGYTGNPVTQNEDWIPVVDGIGGVNMVLVPAGCFNMGSNDPDNYPDELPVHEVCFDAPFWMDQTEVTNQQFVNFAGTAQVSSIYIGALRPRDNVNWAEANAFCTLRGGRLPTEAEWEYAARGPDSLLFPWGSAWDADLAVVGRAVGTGTQDTGSIPENASWVGALDMTGNVWEWTTSAYLPYPFNSGDSDHTLPEAGDEVPDRVLRGSSWYNPEVRFARTTYRAYIEPEARNPAYGFRCVRDFEGA
ncbi:MAG: SUMF1/EgtB/PvdO family nonheme iron enzyme, partial [Anaerolineae bacterium]|nr:SUMF1/EgtB/PvdO family nonheme iron enzyme [Anaerolineae bacterium]